MQIKKYFLAWPLKKANCALNDWTSQPSTGPTQTKAEFITTNEENFFSTLKVEQLFLEQISTLSTSTMTT